MIITHSSSEAGWSSGDSNCDEGASSLPSSFDEETGVPFTMLNVTNNRNDSKIRGFICPSILNVFLKQQTGSYSWKKKLKLVYILKHLVNEAKFLESTGGTRMSRNRDTNSCFNKRTCSVPSWRLTSCFMWFEIWLCFLNDRKDFPWTRFTWFFFGQHSIESHNVFSTRCWCECRTTRLCVSSTTKIPRICNQWFTYLKFRRTIKVISWNVWLFEKLLVLQVQQTDFDAIDKKK